MVNPLHNIILLTLIYKSCISFLDFPNDNIRRSPALDIIGGYPSFLGSIYIYNGDSDEGLTHIKPKSSRFTPLSTILRFTPIGIRCSNLTSINWGCEVICPKNDPNCTLKHQADNEGNLLKTATVYGKKSIDGYVYGDEMRTNGQLSMLRPDASGLCTDLYKQPMKFKVNYTASCRWYFHTEKGCDVSELIKFLSNQMNGTKVCDRTGNQCAVPIFRNIATVPSGQKCDNYSVMRVSLATRQGLVLGMLVKFLPSSNRCRESYCVLTTKILFQEVSQRSLDKMKMSRYENSEGRFRCPSEVTCPAELFYFLNLFDLGEFSTQFFVVIPVLVLLLLHVS
ncbi:unnamed protein product [Litomosoides sigmodontis]|uniref:Uncharacterized protein n=1 Tax=Litomosoides sigmodontis TaxID=42156 RepID=A0A3P6U6X8_LITSI|nr:unnamed protein product [Litomosoides sigmodontis]